MINILMVGVGEKRVGGMNAVANIYKTNNEFNKKVKLTYIPTSTNGSKLIRFLYMLIGYVRIVAHLVFKETDIVHIHMAEKGSVFRKGVIARISKKFNKKVIIHLHAGPFMNWYSQLSSSNKQRVDKYFAASDVVIALGEYWKIELSKIVPEEKIITMYNGTLIPKNNPYSGKSKNIAYFGVLKKEKGVYDLIAAISKINKEIPDDIKVLMCGNDLEGNFEKIVNDYGLSDRVSFLGWVDAKEQNKILKNTMISVLPSYYEGLSMTIIESMSYGVPIITTNISTMPEVLGEYKYLVMPGDIDALSMYLLELINDNKQRENISRYEYERAKNIFSVDTFIHNTLMLYDKIMGKKI